MILNDRITKSMKSANANTIGSRTDERNKTLPHVKSGGFGKGKTQNIVRIDLSIGENFTDPKGDSLGFTGTGAGDNHDRTLNSINGLALLGIQAVIFGLKVFKKS